MIEFYETIDDIPIERYHMFTRYLMQISGIGNDIDAVLLRLQSIDFHLRAKNFNKAIDEKNNLVLTFMSIFEQLDYKLIAMSAMVKKIDNEEVEIHSETDLKAMSERLPKLLKLSKSQLIDMLEKKKTV